MLSILVLILTLHEAHSACLPQETCTENPAVQQKIVDIHNAYRRAVEPPASDMLMMSYSEEAAVNVKAWLDGCVLAHGAPSTRMIDGYEYGENLFYSSAAMSWADVIGAWHSEVNHFKYPNISTNGEHIGHYTQVIWNSSYKVGCASTMCPNNIYFYGCHYYRAGNFRGYQPYTIGEACGSCPNNCTDGLCTNPCPYINRYINCPMMKATSGCSNWLVKSWCPAACQCSPEKEIIPIY